jgi:prepilin-type N-terminal cleavage/methylation domain-containing protein
VFKLHRDLQERRKAGESSESGFTLIELLIVIVVLGILAAIVIFSLTGVTGQSAQAACNTDAKSVETAVAAYEANPPTGIAPGTAPTSMASLVPNYLHSQPTATTASNGYAITLSSGAVQVATPTSAASNYDVTGTTPNPCNSAT